MTEWVTYGSVGGAAGNSRSYPEPAICGRVPTCGTTERTPAANAGYRDDIGSLARGALS